MTAHQTVLAIDKSREVLRVVRSVLTRSGIEGDVLTAHDYASALALVTELDDDLDLVIVERDDEIGAFLSDLRERHEDVGVVLIEGDGLYGPSVPEPYSVLRKPFGAGELLRAASSALRRLPSTGHFEDWRGPGYG